MAEVTAAAAAAAAVAPGQVRVQVCHALPSEAFLETLLLPAGSTLAQAIAASGLATRFPGLDLTQAKVGIFGKLKMPETVLRDGDRIEVYRPLLADPKESRRKRAQHKARADTKTNSGR